MGAARGPEDQSWTRPAGMPLVVVGHWRRVGEEGVRLSRAMAAACELRPRGLCAGRRRGGPCRRRRSGDVGDVPGAGVPRRARDSDAPRRGAGPLRGWRAEGMS